MDFDFFEKLSSKEAKAYLDNFLNGAEVGFLGMQPEMIADGINVDFTIDSVSPVFKWIVARLKTLPEKEDKSLPVWIRETESYKKGLYSFDEASNILILRFAYYLGESFVKNYNLKWSIGKSKTMQQNMPVVTGFKNKMELAVFVVSKNMVMKTIEGNQTADAATAIQTWVSFVE